MYTEVTGARYVVVHVRAWHLYMQTPSIGLTSGAETDIQSALAITDG